MRTLIFGALGQLGRDLVATFKEHGAAVMGVDLDEADVVSRDSVESICADFKPAVVVNAAAYTDVDGAEDHEAEAFRINEEGARNVALAARQCDAPVVYYSTDYVFDGTSTRPYEPDDPLCPLGVYGRSKAAGEKAVREANPRHFIIRTAWLYGPGGNNFVEKIRALAQKRDTLRVVYDEVGSPTHTADLARVTVELAHTEAYGTYHAVNAKVCNRYQLACAIVRLAGLGTTIEPCPSAEYPSKAQRPAYSALSNKKLETVTGVFMPTWEIALEEYFARNSQSSGP